MEMTREEAIKIMENEVRCVRNPNCERLECRNCYLVMPEHKVLKAYEVAIKALEQEPCGDAISRQWLMECVNEGWIKFDTEKDENRFIHLVRDIAPSAQPEQHPDEWCTDCKEYDQTKHCCPRFNKVIRGVIKEVRNERDRFNQ